MPVFEYKATNPAGEAVQGVLEGSSLVAAADALAKQGLVVQHVSEARVEAPKSQVPKSGSQIAAQNFQAEIERRRAQMEVPPPTTARSALITDVVAPLFLKVPLSQLLFFFRQLSTMLNARVPIIS